MQLLVSRIKSPMPSMMCHKNTLYDGSNCLIANHREKIVNKEEEKKITWWNQILVTVLYIHLCYYLSDMCNVTWNYSAREKKKHYHVLVISVMKMCMIIGNFLKKLLLYTQFPFSCACSLKNASEAVVNEWRRRNRNILRVLPPRQWQTQIWFLSSDKLNFKRLVVLQNIHIVQTLL